MSREVTGFGAGFGGRCGRRRVWWRRGRYAEPSAEGSAPGEGKTLELGYIEWDESVANSNLIKMIAEEDLGYEEVELQLADVGPVFQGVAGGDTDVPCRIT